MLQVLQQERNPLVATLQDDPDKIVEKVKAKIQTDINNEVLQMEKFADQNIFDYEETDAGIEVDTMTDIMAPPGGGGKKKDEAEKKKKLEVFREKLMKFVNRILKRNKVEVDKNAIPFEELSKNEKISQSKMNRAEFEEKLSLFKFYLADNFY